MHAGLIGSAELAELVARRARRRLLPGAVALGRLAGLLAEAVAGPAQAYETQVDETKADPAPGPTAELTAELEFLPGPEGHPQIRVHIRGSLPLVCQRCLEAVAWPVAVDELLTVVGSDAEAQGLADPFDTTIMPAEGLDPGELVVDEVLASLPLAPMHAPGTGQGPCAAETAPGGDAPAVETHRPFADLRARLKGRGGE
jgi:hypothetical protein